MQNTLYFLIPAFNEAQSISNVINELLENNQRNILVINDGSTDNTAEIIAQFSEVKLINHIINRGQGASLATGFEYLSSIVNCEFVCTYDADGQHRLEDVLAMQEILLMQPDLDIVIGSRFLETTDTNAPLTRKIVLRLGVLFLRFVYGLEITDAHNGLRVIRKRVLWQMTPKLDDFSHASEMTYLIKVHKLKFQEYPTDIIYSEYSLSKGQSSLNAIKIALKTILHKFTVLIFE